MTLYLCVLGPERCEFSKVREHAFDSLPHFRSIAVSHADVGQLCQTAHYLVPDAPDKELLTVDTQ